MTLAIFWKPLPTLLACKSLFHWPLSIALTEHSLRADLSDVNKTDLTRAGLIETTLPPIVLIVCTGETLCFRHPPPSHLRIWEGTLRPPTTPLQWITPHVARFHFPPPALRQWIAPHITPFLSRLFIRERIAQPPICYPRRFPPAQPYLRPPRL